MTAQIGDTIEIDGKKHLLACCPPLPWSHHDLIEQSDEEMDARYDFHLYNSTACWRGYVADWCIADERLYFVGCSGRYDYQGQKALFAHWVTEELRLPMGGMLHYLHMGFGSIHERDLFICVEKGVVVARRIVDNRGIAMDDRENLQRGWSHLPSKRTVRPGYPDDTD